MSLSLSLSLSLYVYECIRQLVRSWGAEQFGLESIHHKSNDATRRDATLPMQSLPPVEGDLYVVKRGSVLLLATPSGNGKAPAAVLALPPVILESSNVASRRVVTVVVIVPRSSAHVRPSVPPSVGPSRRFVGRCSVQCFDNTRRDANHDTVRRNYSRPCGRRCILST